MSIGKMVYFVPDIMTAIRGEIVRIERLGRHITAVTICTKTGELHTGSPNQFSVGYPSILNYWKA